VKCELKSNAAVSDLWSGGVPISSRRARRPCSTRRRLLLRLLLPELVAHDDPRGWTAGDKD